MSVVFHRAVSSGWPAVLLRRLVVACALASTPAVLSSLPVANVLENGLPATAQSAIRTLTELERSGSRQCAGMTRRSRSASRSRCIHDRRRSCAGH
jgi:hypothetical protein